MARRPSGLLDLPAFEGAVRVARFYLDRTDEAVRRLVKRGDEEALHDFRVSLRRLRSNLQAYAPYLATAVSAKRRRKIGKLAAATGGGRDAEVHVAWLEARTADVTAVDAPGFDMLLYELRTGRDAGYGTAVKRAARKFRKLDRGLRRRLDELETAARASGLEDGVRFRTAVERRLPEYAGELDLHLSRVHAPADEAEAHRARIRAKRLRYLLEPIAADIEVAEDLITALRELQDLLGDLHDAQLLKSLVADLRGRASAEAQPGLGTVTGWLDREQSDLFARLREMWLGDRSVAFFAAVEAVRELLVSSGAPDIEIERKYLLSGVPAVLEGQPYRAIDQGYLPGKRLQERVRRVRRDGGEWYVRTVKIGSGIRRIELQEDTDRRTFDILWPLTAGRRVVKRRYRVPEAGLVWEVDVFADRDLVLAEVELPTEDVQPRLPEWIAPYVVREVTGESAYVNINLAR